MAPNEIPTLPSYRTPARPVDHIASWSAFRSEIERSLGLLCHMRLQVSLFSVRIAGMPDAAAAAIVESLIRLGSVGRLWDGTIGLLYLGPRAPGSAGDVTLMRHVHDLIEQKLAVQGFAALGGRIEVSATHAWTDTISGVEELARPLVEAASLEATPRRQVSFVASLARFAH